MYYTELPNIDQLMIRCICMQNGMTPLQRACSKPGNEEVIRLLIQHGADVNIKNVVSEIFNLSCILWVLDDFISAGVN